MRVEVKLFGVFEVAVGLREEPQVISAKHWRAKRARWLLQLIALQRGAQLHRDLVLEALWPDSDSEAAANRLHHTLHVLRKIFAQHGVDAAESVVQAQGGMVQLNPAYALVIDACEFQRLVSQARSDADEASRAEALAQAIALYTGDLLINEPYEDWVAQSREGYKRDYVWALERLARVRRDSDQREAAIELYKKLVEAEPTHEGAHRALMQLFEEGGHPERAMLQYIACKRYLERDLDVPPSSETEALADAINDREKQKRAQAQQEKAMAGGGDDATGGAKPRYSAPAHAIALLGREPDLATLARWLAEDKVRLISIVGSAGLGKTRLVHALAEHCQDQFKDGVTAIALTTLSEPDQFVGQLAVALGVTAQGETELAAVSRYLAGRQLLLVLDRFEHILPAAQQVSALLAAAPHIKVLATTQAPLRIPAERLYDLPSLLHSAASAATALFRAVAANLNVHFDGDQYVAPIGQICEKLGGNALAIELAAAQTQLYTLPEILSGLDQPLNLLNNPIHVLEQQHRSLRDAIEWSHRLLNDETKRIFAMLGVFAAAFTLDDATAVLKDFCDKPTLTRTLQTLIDRHLIVRSEHTTQSTAGSTLTLRFAFLDAVKHFAEEKFAVSETHQAVETHHAQYFTEKCAVLVADSRRGDLARAIAEFSHVEKDALASLRWLRDSRVRVGFLRITFSITFFQLWTSQTNLAKKTALDAIAETEPLCPEERVHVAWCYLIYAACLSFEGNHAMRIATARKALRLAKNCDDPTLTRKAIESIALASAHHFDLSTARHICVKQILINRQRGAHDYLMIDYQLLVAVELLDGKLHDALVTSSSGLELAIRTANSMRVALFQTTHAEVLLNIGDVNLAANEIKEASSNTWIAIPDVMLLQRNYINSLIALERLDFDAANTLLALISGDRILKSTQIFRTLLFVLKNTVAFEQDDFDTFEKIADEDVTTLCDCEWAYFWVRYWVYFVKYSAKQNNWGGVRVALTRLTPILKKTKNGLWYAWLFDACSFVLVEQREWQGAESLLGRSKQLIETAGIKATPRQQRDWQRIEIAIKSQRESAAQMVTKVSSAGRTVIPFKRTTIKPLKWHGASAETLRSLKEHMTHYLH